MNYCHKKVICVSNSRLYFSYINEVNLTRLRLQGSIRRNPRYRLWTQGAGFVYILKLHFALRQRLTGVFVSTLGRVQTM